MRFILFIILLCIIAALCSCTKEIETCKYCYILSMKYTREKVYLRTDTTYQDVLCGYWLEVFRQAKDTDFIVCDQNLYEKRIHIVK